MKPILFNTEMTKAILDGRKTVTRRVIKPQYAQCNDGTKIPLDEIAKESDLSTAAPYKASDILYVRETWQIQSMSNADKRIKIMYKDGDVGSELYTYYVDDITYEKMLRYADNKFHPSIHMPKEAARLFLKVTGVRAERLQEISRDDAKAEGIKSYWDKPHDNVAPFVGASKEVDGALCSERREAFMQLWNSTIPKKDLSKYGWNANPWVWVYEFERVEKDD